MEEGGAVIAWDECGCEGGNHRTREETGTGEEQRHPCASCMCTHVRVLLSPLCLCSCRLISFFGSFYYSDLEKLVPFSLLFRALPPIDRVLNNDCVSFSSFDKRLE
jgi:hypothetical protein